MKKLLIAAALAACAAPALAQVGVSVNIGDPGFYGQINIGDAPQPQVLYTQPVVVQRDRGYDGGPVYLRVPPGHEKHWDKHCREYNACGRPVYFVRDDWYNNVYAPRYRHGRDDRGYDHDRDRDRHDDHGHDDDHGRGPDHDRGRDDH